MNSVEHGMYRSIIMTGRARNCRKVKRGFKTKREATEWEHHFRMKEAADLDMIFGELIFFLSNDLNMVLVPCKLMQ